MNNKYIREKYHNLLNDSDFDKLELELKNPNIFQILSVSRTEIRHSNFLGWLLDPNASHRLGKLFLTKILRRIISVSEIPIEVDEFDIESLNYNNVELRREWRNIDLLIIFDELVICIENKIDSKDHSNQLTKYRKIVNDTFAEKRKLFVYLTPTGELPTSKEEREHYIPFSYEGIIEQLENILTIYGSSLNSSVNLYITDYLKTIRRELMKDDNLNELADKIYKNHKELIDFIFENKTDLSSALYPIFEKKIKQSGWVMGSKGKGYARFTTPELKKIIPNNGKGWPQKENFLFEIDYFKTKDKAIFKTVISPTDNEAIKNTLQKAFENVKDKKHYKQPKANLWIAHFIKSWTFKNSDLEGADEQAVLELLDKQWGDITEIVKVVEAELLKYKDELQQYLE